MSGHPGTRWAVVQPCGTPAAYQRHLRHGEQPCQSCRQAESRRKADRRSRPAATAERTGRTP